MLPWINFLLLPQPLSELKLAERGSAVKVADHWGEARGRNLPEQHLQANFDPPNEQSEKNSCACQNGNVDALTLPRTERSQIKRQQQ